MCPRIQFTVTYFIILRIKTEVDCHVAHIETKCPVSISLRTEHIDEVY
jgi:hypothetical protein